MLTSIVYAADAASASSTCTPLAQHLNHLEERLQSGEVAQKIEAYEKALGRWRDAGGSAGSAPACRTQHLGELLCADARALVASINKTVEARAMSVTWKAYMSSLTQREQANASCAQINEYHRLGWKP